MGRELGRHQDSAQVRMPFKVNAKHVEDFPLQPVGTFPQRCDRRDGQVGLVEHHAHRQTHVLVGVAQEVDQPEAIHGVPVVEIIDARDVDEHVEATRLLEKLQRIVQARRRDADPRILPKRTHGDPLESRLQRMRHFLEIVQVHSPVVGRWSLVGCQSWLSPFAPRMDVLSPCERRHLLSYSPTRRDRRSGVCPRIGSSSSARTGWRC